MKMQIFLWFIFATLGCCKDKPIVPKPIISPKTPVIWQYETALKNGLATNNFIYKNMIIQGLDGDGQWCKVWALSLDSGKIVWESQTLPFSSPFRAENVLIQGNLMILSRKSKLLVLNLDNGKLEWVKDIEHVVDVLSIINNKIYINTDDRNEAVSMSFDIGTGTQEINFKLEKVNFDNFEPVLTAPALWKHPNGDHILLFANRSYNGNLFPDYDRYDQLAYNLTADTMLWYKKGEPGIRGSIATPLVLGNKVMYYVSREMICLNPLNGERIWTFTRTPADDISAFKSANIAHIGNTIIAKPDYKYMYGVDLETGNTLWTNSENSSMPYTVRVALNKVWFSSGGIWCIDGVTGKTLIKGWQNKTAGNFISPIAIDEKTGYIYTQKQGIIYCLDSKVLME